VRQWTNAVECGGGIVAVVIDFQKNNFAALSVGDGREKAYPLLPCEINFLKVYNVTSAALFLAISISFNRPLLDRQWVDPHVAVLTSRLLKPYKEHDTQTGYGDAGHSPKIGKRGTDN